MVWKQVEFQNGPPFRKMFPIASRGKIIPPNVSKGVVVMTFNLTTDASKYDLN